MSDPVPVGENEAVALIILGWRVERLVNECGVDLEHTRALALNPHVDWHELEHLLAAGCPLAVALEIVA